MDAQRADQLLSVRGIRRAVAFKSKKSGRTGTLSSTYHPRDILCPSGFCGRKTPTQKSKRRSILEADTPPKRSSYLQTGPGMEGGCEVRGKVDSTQRGKCQFPAAKVIIHLRPARSGRGENQYAQGRSAKTARLKVVRLRTIGNELKF